MRRPLAIALALLLSTLAACTGSSKERASADELPAGADLVAAAAAEMRTVTTARFAIKSEGSAIRDQVGGIGQEPRHPRGGGRDHQAG
jgi:lipoprotein LprG